MRRSHPTTPKSKAQFITSSLGIIPIVERIHRNLNLPVQPVPAALLADGNVGAIGASLERDAHARPLLTDGHDVRQPNDPFGSKLFAPNEHDVIVRQHDQQLLTTKFQVRNVVFVEVFAVVERLEPELAQCFALSVGPHDAVEADEAGKPYAVKALCIKDGGGVANTFSKIYQCVS